ncbi:MAG TPA: hypothetical protein VN673_13600 [Clostridia bacterium]|nr:hypothetical protein [Clostridia bacterium]
MNVTGEGLRISGRAVCRIIAIVPFLLFTPGVAQAQTASPSSAEAQQRESVERQLQELQSMRKDLQRQVEDFNARIKALEVELGATLPKEEAAPSPIESTNRLATTPSSPEDSRPLEEPKFWGAYEPGPAKGFVLVRAPLGELDFGVLGYFRYLNQLGLDSSYTDAFERTKEFDRRQDFQVNRLQLMFRGWLFDERLKYQFWVWTQNTSMGEETQINVGGNAWYEFYDWLTFRAGIFSLPTTRSTSQSFPHWLKIDHRTMGDEFFRGSYTSGIMAEGKIAPGLQYKVALGNHLSTLGVGASQLDPQLNTVATGLWWMPTTKEFGPGLGFGDYEQHEELATLFGIHYSRSREDRQSQPATDGFENTQLYLSDGTLIFSSDPFATGGQINKLTYQMVALEAGFKLKGWSLEGEYYFRLLDEFDVTGNIPEDDVFDHGFQVQASTMLLPKTLQTYVAGSKIFGEYGDPWEVGVGLTYFPFNRKEMRINFQALYESQAPAGTSALPYQPGASGWIYTLDLGVWF